MARRPCGADHPKATLGVGTVVTADDARAAADAGADFLVSPWPAPAVRQVATVPFLEGGFTPAEVAAASAHGVAKLFPAHLGGIAYLRSLLAVLPEARIMPTGGIKLDQVRDWLAAGAFAVWVPREFAYLRAGSAAARLEPSDVDFETKALLISGITAALSPSCAATLLHAAARVCESGGDSGLRPQLPRPAHQRRRREHLLQVDSAACECGAAVHSCRHPGSVRPCRSGRGGGRLPRVGSAVRRGDPRGRRDHGQCSRCCFAAARGTHQISY